MFNQGNNMADIEEGYVTICMPAKLNFLHVIRDTVDEAARDFGFDEEDRAEIVMAVDEATTNIVKHGYGAAERAQDRMFIKVLFSRDRLVIELADEAAEFLPTKDKSMNVDEFLESGESHGFGLYVIHSFMDEVQHEFQEGAGNRLRLVKRLTVKATD